MQIAFQWTPRVLSTGIAAALAVAQAASSAGAPAAQGQARPAFERLKSLAGDWVGTGETPDGPPVRVVYRVTGAGSALVETLFPATEHEMVTVYHLDGPDLVLTHYCAAGNQPHMKLNVAASAADRLVFDFGGGTNLDPAVDQHMHSATFAFADENHIEVEWRSFAKGQPSGTHRFKLTRDLKS